MYQNLAVFQTATDMAMHAGKRQAMTAANIANSDTPGFRAKHMASFAEVVDGQQSLTMKATRGGHLASGIDATGTTLSATTVEPSPNGNAVSLEEEMMKAVEISREHNRALTVYRHAMTVIRTSLGR